MSSITWFPCTWIGLFAAFLFCKGHRCAARLSAQAHPLMPRQFVGMRMAYIALAAGVMALSSGAAYGQWTVINLHPVGPTQSMGNGIDGAQQVGMALSSGVWNASLWNGSAASWINLHPAGATKSFAWGGHGGQQVGDAEVGSLSRASLWTGSAASWVNLHPAGASESRAFSAYSGQQVGWAIVSGQLHASLWSGTAGSWIDLNPPGALTSHARGIDAGGQVGQAAVGGVWRASMWDGSAASWLDLHPAGSSRSFALGIGGGQQVGWAEFGGGAERASLWSGSAGSWVDLHPVGASYSQAVAVHDGIQVGHAQIGASRHASLWTGTAGSWEDLRLVLNGLWGDTLATGVWSDSVNTYVVGSGFNVDTGRNEALLWVRPIPEPASAGLMALGGLALIRHRRSRQHRHDRGVHPCGARAETNRKKGLTSVITGGGVALFALVTMLTHSTVTQAGSFNIDIGIGPSPSNTYGAAAGQPGFWNVAVGGGAPVPLTDIAGGATGVTLMYGDMGWDGSFDHAGTSGHDEQLLDDFITWPPSGPMSYTIAGLPAGDYQFYSYSFAPNGANSSVDIAGSPEGFQLLGGSWSGSHQLGVTYALHTLTLVQPGNVTVTVGVWNAAWGGFNGLQIVQVPEPASLLLLALGGLLWRKRNRHG